MESAKCPVCGKSVATLLLHLVAVEGLMDETAHLLVESDWMTQDAVQLRSKYWDLRHHADAIVRHMEKA